MLSSKVQCSFLTINLKTNGFTFSTSGVFFQRSMFLHSSTSIPLHPSPSVQSNNTRRKLVPAHCIKIEDNIGYVQPREKRAKSIRYGIQTRQEPDRSSARLTSLLNRSWHCYRLATRLTLGLTPWYLSSNPSRPTQSSRYRPYYTGGGLIRSGAFKDYFIRHNAAVSQGNPQAMMGPANQIMPIMGR